MTLARDPSPAAIRIRPARSADAAAVSLIHRSDVFAWKTWDADGNARWAEFENLTALERWSNGGPWMDDELCRAHLEHMSAPTRVSLVAEMDDALLAEAEAYFGQEPPPIGTCLNLAVIFTRRGFAGKGLGSALMRALLDLARSRSCSSLTVSSMSAPDFYTHFGFTLWKRWRSIDVQTHLRNLRYTSEPCGLAPAPLPAGWGMALGGIGSAAQMWDRLDPGERPAPDAHHPAVPLAYDLEARSGRERARIAFEPVRHAPAKATAYAWTPEGRWPARMWAMLGDCAARAGLAEITTWVDVESLAQAPQDLRWGNEFREVWRLTL
jgi:GNAT superfamily N-acetyltransferase